MAKKTKTNFKDFIEYKPQIMKFLDKEETELALKYHPIIKEMRNKHLTVKEIHDLYIDEETKKYTLTIKTIYRYLEKLEEKNLVIVSGHRITQNKTQAEKLYTRTANIFFKSYAEKQTPQAIKKRKATSKNLYVIISEMGNGSIITYEKFEKLILNLQDFEQQLIEEISRKVPSSKVLSEIYSEVDIDHVNYLNEFSAKLLFIIKYPELIKELQNIYN
ncbi:MAG TPA: hypothetical protein VMZ29_01245 [Candidatus Bathyarchaeia archaeon]|nr:hypothetical protein [Candidatus Bathyarchaeia archaeon]